MVIDFGYGVDSVALVNVIYRFVYRHLSVYFSVYTVLLLTTKFNVLFITSKLADDLVE